MLAATPVEFPVTKRGLGFERAQIAAVSTALEAVGFEILDSHVKHCVAGALASGDEEVAAEKSRELLEAVHPPAAR